METAAGHTFRGRLNLTLAGRPTLLHKWSGASKPLIFHATLSMYRGELEGSGSWKPL